jgi:hypothetical protein
LNIHQWQVYPSWLVRHLLAKVSTSWLMHISHSSICFCLLSMVCREERMNTYLKKWRNKQTYTFSRLDCVNTNNILQWILVFNNDYTRFTSCFNRILWLFRCHHSNSMSSLLCLSLHDKNRSSRYFHFSFVFFFVIFSSYI